MTSYRRTIAPTLFLLCLAAADILFFGLLKTIIFEPGRLLGILYFSFAGLVIPLGMAMLASRRNERWERTVYYDSAGKEVARSAWTLKGIVQSIGSLNFLTCFTILGVLVGTGYGIYWAVKGTRPWEPPLEGVLPGKWQLAHPLKPAKYAGVSSVFVVREFGQDRYLYLMCDGAGSVVDFGSVTIRGQTLDELTATAGDDEFLISIRRTKRRSSFHFLDSEPEPGQSGEFHRERALNDLRGRISFDIEAGGCVTEATLDPEFKAELERASRLLNRAIKDKGRTSR